MNTIISSIFGGFVSWKTTLTGLIAAIAVLLHTFNVITITPEQQGTLVAFFVLLIGWFSKDSDKIGKPTDEKH